MSSSTSTITSAADQFDNDIELAETVNTDATLPTHRVPPNNDNHTVASRARAAILTRLTERTWFLHVERYAPVIGIVIAAAALSVTVFGIIISTISAVTVK